MKSDKILDPAFNVVLEDKQLACNLDKELILNHLMNLTNDCLLQPTETQFSFLQKRVKQLEKELKESIKTWNVIVPLEGINLEKELSIDLGSIKIFVLSEKDGEKLEDLILEIIKNNPHYDEDKKYEIAKIYRQKFISDRIGNVVASVEINATTNLVLKRALVEIRRALSVLNLIFLYPFHNFNKFNVKCENYPSGARRFILTSVRNCKPLAQRVGSKRNVRINSDTILNLNQNPIFLYYRKILSKRNRNDVEKRVLSAIYLYAEAIGAPRPQEEPTESLINNYDERVGEPWTLAPRFLLLFIALESLCLLSKKERSISKNLAKRVAFLVIETADDRNWLSEEIRKLYKKRSSIIHHGSGEIDESDFRFLADITRAAIISYFNKCEELGWHSNSDFGEWVKSTKLSNNEKIKKLKLFNERVELLKNFSAGQQILKGKLGVRASEEKDTIVLDFTTLNSEQITAFLCILRMFSMDRDGISLRLMAKKVYDSSINTTIRKKYLKARKRINGYLNEISSINIKGKSLTNKELLECFLYGEVFHFTQRENFERLIRGSVRVKFWIGNIEEETIESNRTGSGEVSTEIIKSALIKILEFYLQRLLEIRDLNYETIDLLEVMNQI